jgi:hypothetical protein
MAWLELHQSIFTHRKTYELADLLDLPEVYVVGHLASLWSWSLDNAPDGVIAASPRTISKAAQWPGDPQTFVNALASVGFLECNGDETVIHDWEDYAGKLIEHRHSNAERQRTWRAKKTERLHNGDITPTSPSRNGATVPNRTVPNRTVPNHETTQAEQVQPAARAPEATPAVSTPVTTKPEPPASAEPTLPVAEPVTTPPVSAPPPRAAPKTNKATDVIDHIRAAGQEPATNPRDFQAIKACSASAKDIAAAYVAMASGEWGDEWMLKNLSVATACTRVNGFLAWRQGVKVRSPVPLDFKQANYQAKQDMLTRIAGGEVP